MIGDIDPRIMSDFTRDLIRKEHAERSYANILDNYEKYGLNYIEAEFIAWICKAHTKSFYEWDEIEKISKKDEVDLIAIAAILRLISIMGLVVDKIKYTDLANLSHSFMDDLIINKYKHYSWYGRKKVDHTIDQIRWKYEKEYIMSLIISNIRTVKNDWDI